MNQLFRNISTPLNHRSCLSDFDFLDNSKKNVNISEFSRLTRKNTIHTLSLKWYENNEGTEFSLNKICNASKNHKMNHRIMDTITHLLPEASPYGLSYRNALCKGRIRYHLCIFQPRRDHSQLRKRYLYTDLQAYN